MLGIHLISLLAKELRKDMFLKLGPKNANDKRELSRLRPAWEGQWGPLEYA